MARNRRNKAIGSNVAGTVKQLIGLTISKGHDANFTRILPKTMDKLVAEGLFIKIDDTYQITEKGKKILKDFENKEKLK